jgi:hypothetical protein
MYRIELAPGEETVFRTFEELATGVRNGVVTPRARIYHAASQKWLPIEFNPHYKRAVENPAAKPGGRRRGASPSAAPSPGLFGSVLASSGAVPMPAPSTSDPGALAPAGSDAVTSDKNTLGPSPSGESGPVVSAAGPVPDIAGAAGSGPAGAAPATSLDAAFEMAAPAPETGEGKVSESPYSGPAPSELAPSELAPSELVSADAQDSEFSNTMHTPHVPVSVAPMDGEHVAPTSRPVPFDTIAGSVADMPVAPAPETIVALLSAPAVGASTLDHAISHAPRSALAPGAPSPTGDASVEEPVFLRLGTESPELELPKISYPEITPSEEPVAHRPRTMGRSRRAVRLAGAAVVLVAGAYAGVSALAPARGDAAVPVATVADRPAMPSVASHAVTPAAAAGPKPVATTVSAPPAPAPVRATAPSPAPPPPAPARLNPSLPASSGFAPALEPRALVSSAAAKTAVAVRSSSPVDSSSVAPAPAALDLSVPALPQADSLVATPRPPADSALKRILRAVSGSKDVPPQR